MRSWRPAKLAVFEMRVIDSIAESICSWFAAISSSLTPPVLALFTMSELIELSRSATSAR